MAISTEVPAEQVTVEVDPTFDESILRATGQRVRTFENAGKRVLEVTILGVKVTVTSVPLRHLVTEDDFFQPHRTLAKAVVNELRRRADALEQEQVHDAELVEEPRS